MTPEEEVRRGEAAQRIMDDPIFQDARSKLFEHLSQLRREVPIHATGMHTRLIEMEQLAHEFFKFFEYILQTGKLAQARWAQEERQRSFREQAIALFGKIGRNAL